jgi:hypothetical protein
MKGGRTTHWLSHTRFTQQEVKGGIWPQDTDDSEQAERLPDHFDRHHQRQVRCSPCSPDVRLSLLPSCEDGERGAGGFPARHHTHQPRCAETPSSQEHDAAQSAMLKRGCRRLCLLVLAAAVSRQQEVREPSPLLPAIAAASERACQKGKGRGRKLVTEDSKPVGSGEIIYVIFQNK